MKIPEEKNPGPEKSIFGPPTGRKSTALIPNPTVSPTARPPRRKWWADLLSFLFLLIGLVAIIASIYYIRSFLGGTVLNRASARKPVSVQQPVAVPTLARTGVAVARSVATSVPATVELPTATVVVPTVSNTQVTATVASTSPEAVTAVITLPKIEFSAKPAPDAPAGAPNPLFGPNYDSNDGKPVYLCAADPFVSHLTLMQMQVSGKDIAHGFHLGIVPLGLTPVYDLGEDTYIQKVIEGEWDCVLDRVDENAELNIGAITAIIDESAGANGIWGRDIASYEQLAGKRIGYVEKSSAKYFMLHTLFLLPLETRKTVTTTGYQTAEAAIAAFNKGELDAVSTWQPLLANTTQTGGKPVLSTDQLRVVIDAIITSRKSIQSRPQVVQAFHEAWFDTLRDQTDDLPVAANQISAWGNQKWTGLSSEATLADMTQQLKWVATANLSDNVAIMNNPTSMLRAMKTVRDIHIANGDTVSDLPEAQLIDGQFVQALKDRSDLQPTKKSVNNTFSLAATATTGGAAPEVPLTTTASVAVAADVTNTTIISGAEPAAATLTVLPCRKFSFLPDSAALTLESQRVLDVCVLPALQQRIGLFLNIKGSAAWPGPKGTYSQTQIQEIATARARAIADYLVAKGLDRARFVIEGVLPPQEHWETIDGVQQAADRYVEMTLMSGGR